MIPFSVQSEREIDKAHVEGNVIVISGENLEERDPTTCSVLRT